jgi:hypothetical protein
LLFVGHIAGMHASRPGHIGLRRVHVGVADVLGGLRWYIGRIHSVLITCRFWGIEARLSQVRSVPSRQSKYLISDATYLDEIFPFRFRHQRLQLGGGEGVDETGLRHDQQQHLGAGQHG